MNSYSNSHAGIGISSYSIMPKTLLREIESVKSRGANVSIGYSDDVAYDDFDRVMRMYDQLHNSGREFSNYQDEVDSKYKVSIAKKILFLTNPSRKYLHLKSIDKDLEPHRGRLLYDDIHAMPWHKQRGSAMALLTITAAHELITPESTGIYPTMSGPLDEKIISFVFDERCSTLSGLALKDAIIKTEIDFTGRAQKEAKSYAEHKIDKLEQFVKAPSTEGFKNIVQYCTDSLGIRSRAAEVSEVIRSHTIEHGLAADGNELLIMSFGCGTAWPILETMRKLHDTKGVRCRVILLDQDPVALAAAALLAEKMGLGGQIEMHCQKLFNRLGRPVDMSRLLKGRTIDIYEDSGLREYLPDRIYRLLTKEAWKNLSPRGLITTGNMNKNRPQSEFVGGLMGWVPHVQKRTIDECLKLHHRGGIPRSASQVRVTRDGVYSLYFSSRCFMTN